MKKIFFIILILLIFLMSLMVGLQIYFNNKLDTTQKQLEEIIDEAEIGWSEIKLVNAPEILEGMTPVIFEEGNSEPITATENVLSENSWYDYIVQTSSTEIEGSSKWANVKTQDGSLWVWIPRFAYKINYTNIEDKTEGGNIDIVFLKGITNNNKDNVDVTELGYIIHPAFRDGTINNYSNGEWDKELTGIWVSKFEAGYTGIANTNTQNILPIKSNEVYEHNGKNLIERFEKGVSMINYPIFVGQAYSYNNLLASEMFKLSQALTTEGNPYGLDNNTTDSHMIKNSEWGAVAYLAHSQYGRKGTKVTINNIYIEKKGEEYASDAKHAGHEQEKDQYTITGYGANEINGQKYLIDGNKNIENSYEESYAWFTSKGKLASTTGNLYGVYDLNGASSEYVAAYIAGISDTSKNSYAKNMVMSETNTKYCTIYETHENNQKIGDAIFETSESDGAYKSWNDELSFYMNSNSGLSLRSGSFDLGKRSGIFSYNNHSGHDYLSYTFRVILTKK